MSSKVTCLCLDKDKRAIHTGIVNMMGNKYWRNRQILHSYYDMKDGLDLLLKGMKQEFPNNKLDVLFQHPSPSINDISTYNYAGKVCINALEDNIIESIHFVYNVKGIEPIQKKPNCWIYENLFSCFLQDATFSRRDIKRLYISDNNIIADLNQNEVSHPLFKTVSRKGWTLLKKGEVHSFSICYV